MKNSLFLILILIFLLIVSCSSHDPDKNNYVNDNNGNDDDPRNITIYNSDIDIFFGGFSSVDLVGNVLPLENFRVSDGKDSSSNPYLEKHSSMRDDFITYSQITTTVSEAVKKALHFSSIEGVDIDNTTAYYSTYGLENAEDQYSTTTIKVYVELRAYPTCEFSNPSGRDPRTYEFAITLRASKSITGINRVQIPIARQDYNLYSLAAEVTGVARGGWGNTINNIKVESFSDYSMENITIPTHIGRGYAVSNPPPPLSIKNSAEIRENATIYLIEKVFPYLDVYEINEIKRPFINDNERFGIHVYKKGIYEYRARVKDNYILMSDVPSIPSRLITFTMYGSK